MRVGAAVSRAEQQQTSATALRLVMAPRLRRGLEFVLTVAGANGWIVGDVVERKPRWSILPHDCVGVVPGG